MTQDGSSEAVSAPDLTRTIRRHWGKVLAALIRQFGDIATAEDALQDAMEAALRRWPTNGVPASPGGWLYTSARRRMIDNLRRVQRHAEKSDAIAHHLHITAAENVEATDPSEDDGTEAMTQDEIPDERLKLIFTCCHPAIDAKIRVPLTLQTLCGFTAAETARAFLSNEKAMAQRLVRAKRKIKVAGIPFAIPQASERPVRLANVLQVIYLIFNEGYQASKGDQLIRQSLCEEACRLAETVTLLLPDEPEALGLLALIYFHDARRTAREDSDGHFVSLEDQDRRQWDQLKIRKGHAALKQAAQCHGPKGAYRLQAEISACHIAARSFQDTDWTKIIACYEQLSALTPSPVITLNALVARSFVEEVAEVLPEVQELGKDSRLQSYQPYHVALADLYRRLGKRAEAKIAYTRAIELSATTQERAFLERRLDTL